MNSIRRHPEYQNQVGRYHRVGMRYDFTGFAVSSFYAKALQAKSFGVAEKTWELNVAFKIGSSKDSRKTEDDFIPVEETPLTDPVDESSQESAPSIEEGEINSEEEKASQSNESSESSPIQQDDNSAAPAGNEEEEKTPRIDDPLPEKPIETPESLRQELEKTKAQQSQVGSEMDQFYLLEEGPSDYKSPERRIDEEYLEAEKELQRLDRVNQLLLKNQSSSPGSTQP